MTDETKRRRRKPKAGSIEDARLILWQGIQRAAGMLGDDALTPEMTLKLLHGLSQATGTYAKVVESSDLAQRIEALELATQEGNA